MKLQPVTPTFSMWTLIQYDRISQIIIDIVSAHLKGSGVH